MHTDVWSPAPVSIVEPTAWRRALWIVAVAFVAALFTHFVVLRGFQSSGDEFAYFWQAQAFAAGSVTAVTPEPQAAFAINHLGDRDGRRFSKYTPGWPLLLAAGVWLGVPGLVNPFLAALALSAIYRLACSWVGCRAAAIGTMLTGASPFFLLNAGSYFSHPSCLFALTALALSLTWSVERRVSWPLAIAGASVALAALIRPYSAALLAGPLLMAFGVEVMRQRRALKAAAWFAAGALPWLVFFAFVNQNVTGRWTMTAWAYFDPTETIGFGTQGHTLVRGVKLAVRQIGEGFVYTFFLSPLLLLPATRATFSRRVLLWVMLAAPIIGYIFWWTHGGNRYGPRFYFEALLPFTLLTGAGLERLLATRAWRPVVAVGIAAGLISLVVASSVANRRVEARRAMYRAVDEAGLDAAVVLAQTASADLTRSDLARNPPDFQAARVLFGISRGPALDREVADRFPDRTIYLYRWNESGGLIEVGAVPRRAK